MSICLQDPTTRRCMVPDDHEIRIVEMICPEKHSIAALAYESDGKPIPERLEDMKRGVAKAGLPSSCHLCGKPLKFNDWTSIFRSLEEATTYLASRFDKRLEHW